MSETAVTPIGIDLGTTYSACAIARDGEIILIPNALGEYLTPSVVGLDDDGTILVGRAARERLISHPEVTTAFFKRLMGASAKVSLGKLRKRVFSPTELSSLVLRSLKEDAERMLDQPVTHAVVSVPAYFNQAQRQATRDAAQLAGLTVNRLVNEPTAAAIAHGLDTLRERCYMILDLGGGTFDCSVLEYFDGVLEVHATSGDSALGGEDFNDAIVSRFTEEHELEGLAPTDQQRLYARVETAKRAMGDASKKAVIDFVLGDREYTTTLDEGYLSKAAAPLLLRMQGAMERALGDAQMGAAQIDEVVLVGGSARLGAFRSLVARLFGRLPRMEGDPDITVTRGAALQAALVARDRALDDVVLTDVCPFSLGIAAVEGADPNGVPVFSPIIERNTAVPASRVNTYYTVADQQTRIQVSIYQGESRRLQQNLHLGDLDVAVPPEPAGAQSIDVRFSYDVNGLLEVDVTNTKSGSTRQLRIENTPGTLSEEELARAAERLAALKVLPHDRADVRAVTARADRLYASSLGDRREEIGIHMAKFEQVLRRQNPREIEEAVETLKTTLDHYDTDVW